MKILHLDPNHPLLIEAFDAMGFENEEDYTGDREAVLAKIDRYDGIVVRSRLPIDQVLLQKAVNLKFIGRVGAGMENIDTAYAKSRNIFLAAAPEGNRNAVGEHTLGMLLSLLHKLNKCDREVRQGLWDREGNRGTELEGKTVGIVGYGHMGKAFARKLQGFDIEVICYDKQGGVGDEYARQVGIMELRQKADILSLHLPQAPDTVGLVHAEWLQGFHKDIWLLNTGRGKCVVTQDLVAALRLGKVRGAALDVLEYEKTSFERLFAEGGLPEAFQYLAMADNVVLSPHVAGWTVESKEKLARTIVEKVRARFCKNTSP